MSRSHRASTEPSTLATAVAGASNGARLVHRGRLEHSVLGVPRPSEETAAPHRDCWLRHTQRSRARITTHHRLITAPQSNAPPPPRAHGRRACTAPARRVSASCGRCDATAVSSFPVAAGTERPQASHLSARCRSSWRALATDLDRSTVSTVPARRHPSRRSRPPTASPSTESPGQGRSARSQHGLRSSIPVPGGPWAVRHPFATFSVASRRLDVRPAQSTASLGRRPSTQYVVTKPLMGSG